MDDVITSERRDRVRAVPLFAECSDETLNKILEIATEFEAQRGHVLVQRDDAGSGLFVLEEGRVAVELPGRRVELGEGEFFGELALLDEGVLHTARVAAVTPVRALAIARDDFLSLLESEPKIALAMLRVVAARLVRATRR
jgi:CRP-like cAMP-binding protein